MDKIVWFFIAHNLEFEENVSFKNLTTFRVGGEARFVCYIKDVSELRLLVDFLNENKIKCRVLGDGSNTLAPDKIYEGVIIKFKETLSSYKVLNNESVFAYAGCNLTRLVLDMAEQGYSGLENLAGIFGQVGGAILGNAGAHGTEIKDIIVYVIAMDKRGELKTLNNNDCEFTYRKSAFKHNGLVIVGGLLKLKREDVEKCKQKTFDVLDKRKHFFAEGGNAGSVFKNPDGYFAGKLISEAKINPIRNSGAMLCSFHKNVIVTNEKATSNDVKKLIAKIKKKVYNKFIVKLEEEIYRLS